ncbi:MAG: HAD family hydrolase [Bacteroidales bacterium]
MKLWNGDTLRLVIFDWGDTLMRDYPDKPGPMYTWDRVEEIPGARQLLEYLSKKYSLCVATNAGVSDTEAMRMALQRVNLESYFSGFFSSKDLGVAKPDPGFFLHICRKMQVRPKETLMVGNDYQKDVEGAARAGLHTVFFNKNQQEGAYPQADIVISHLFELISII